MFKIKNPKECYKTGASKYEPLQKWEVELSAMEDLASSTDW